MTDRDRLIELLKPHVSGTACLCESGICELTSCRDCKARRLADHLLANGVIVPPCKVGDWVYVVSQGQGNCMRWSVYEGKVVDIHLNRHNELTVRVENGESFFGYYKPCFIHKTKEKAEQALKERDNK